MRKVFVGWDSREQVAYDVCAHTLNKYSQDISIIPLKQNDLRERGLYSRDGSEGSSTEFTYTRFLVPHLSEYSGWSLFIDCDFLFTRDVNELFALVDDQYAIMCVQHDYTSKTATKMDGQKQISYPKKNWSSCILWNCDHPLNKQVVPEWSNEKSGAFLHRFQWLPDGAVGAIPLEWNWLEGEYDKPNDVPAAIHYTNGGPFFHDYWDCDYSQLWKDEYKDMAGEEYSRPPK